MTEQVGTYSKKLIGMKSAGAPIGSTLPDRLQISAVPLSGGKGHVHLFAEQAVIEHKAKIFKQFNREIGSTTTSVLTTNKIVRVDVVPDDIEEIEECVVRFQLTAGTISAPVEYVPIRIFNHVNALQNKSGGEGEMGKPYGYTLGFMQQMKDIRFLEVRKQRLGIDEYWNEGSRLLTTGSVNEHSFSTEGWWLDMPNMNLRHVVKDEIRFEWYFRSDAYRSSSASDAAAVDLTDFRMEFFYYAHAMEDEGVWKTLIPSHGLSTAFYDITRSTHTFNNATRGQQIELTMNGLSGILAAIWVEIVAAGANGSSPQRGAEQNYLAWDRVYIANSSGQNIQGGQEWTWENMRDYIWPHQFPGSTRWIQRYRYAMLIPFTESLASSLGSGQNKGTHTFDTNQRLFIRFPSTLGVSTVLRFSFILSTTHAVTACTAVTPSTIRAAFKCPISGKICLTAPLAYNSTSAQIAAAVYLLPNWDNRATISFAGVGGTAADIFDGGNTAVDVTFGGAYGSNASITAANFWFTDSYLANVTPLGFELVYTSTPTAGVDGFNDQAVDIRLTGFTYSYIEHVFKNGRSTHTIKRF